MRPFSDQGMGQAEEWAMETATFVPPRAQQRMRKLREQDPWFEGIAYVAEQLESYVNENDGWDGPTGNGLLFQVSTQMTPMDAAVGVQENSLLVLRELSNRLQAMRDGDVASQSRALDQLVQELINERTCPPEVERESLGALGILSEAWMVMRPVREMVEGLRVSEEPDRQEMRFALMVDLRGFAYSVVRFRDKAPETGINHLTDALAMPHAMPLSGGVLTGLVGLMTAALGPRGKFNPSRN